METLNTNSASSVNFNNLHIKQSNHSFTLNFTTMKKQISLMVLAVIASISVAFGQGATHNTSPRPLTNCETGPLNPIAGVPYEYSAGIDPAGGTAYWFATFNNTSFISNSQLTNIQEPVGGDFISSALNYQNDQPGAVSPTTTTITWNEIGLSQISANNPLFLALNYTAGDAGCANNLKAFKINPINAFLVNVLNVGAPAYGDEIEECFSDIASAEYDPLSDLMVYDYGKNLLAFEVVAANFTEQYELSLRIEGLQPGQDANVYWSYSNDFLTATVIPDGPFGNEIIEGPTVETDEVNTGLGVSVYVWLEVNNNNYEGLNDTPITLAVAGLNSANQANIRWDDCGIAVNLAAAAFNLPNAPDYATAVLKARPTVTPGAGLNFIGQ